ncbi:MAG: DNA-3-methyladenine glycosylase I [Hyphomicrobiales bacterium]
MDKRCEWVPSNNDDYIKYHDEEWGKPIHDDNLLFEFLILEGAQAGLSWSTILKKRDNYRKAFDQFDPSKVANYDEIKVQELLNNEGIVRNKLKVNSAIRNAKVFLKIQDEYESFNKYIWNFVNNKPIINNIKTLQDLPASTELSDKISKDLKKRGMNFVGSTIIYAFMQAVGLVDDHEVNCICRKSK